MALDLCPRFSAHRLLQQVPRRMEKTELRHNQTKINNKSDFLPYHILLFAIVQQLALIHDLGQVLNERMLNVNAIEDA